MNANDCTEAAEACRILMRSFAMKWRQTRDPYDLHTAVGYRQKRKDWVRLKLFYLKYR
jgi:hypothetical protein